LRAFPEPDVQYLWLPDTLFEDNTTAVVRVTPTHTTTYVLSSTTNFGCSRLDSITVTVYPKPILNIDDTISYCNGNSVQINLDSSLIYSWTPSYGLSCTQCSNPVIQTDSNIVYAITVSTPDGCNFLDSILLNVFPLPEIEIGTGRKICSGDIVNITAEAPTATGIFWSPAEGLSSTTNRIIQAAPIENTVYTASITDANGCVNSDSVLIEVFNKVQFHLDSITSICKGEIVILKPTVTVASDANIQYQWLPAERFNDAHADSQSIMPRYSGNYQLVISSGNCIPDTQSFYIHVHEGPSVILNAPDFVVANEIFEVSADATGAEMYHWVYDTVSVSNYENTVSASIIQPTMFAVKVTDEYNCSAMQYRMVKVIASCGDDIFIPNAFTPNGDEMNDKLCIRSLEMQAIKIFRIFNRWGELVFETTDINHCWDGYFKGKIVNPDVYVYYAEGICTAGQAKLIKGNVTVVR
jgi:gliding motility-associated-like protein